MRFHHHAALIWSPLFLAIAVSPTLAVDFNRDVRPILSDKCFSCHGPDENDRKAGLRLDTREGALADQGGYAAIVAGNPEKSEAYRRMITGDPRELMPPPKVHKPLSEKEIGILRQWIAEGAAWEMHWSFRSLERPAVPRREDASFVRNDIDRFIGDAQQRHGLAPAAAADPITLARRLHLDLTGLPPSPEEARQFAANPSPEAYEQLAERLLATGQFGERMAIFWLDLVRYADTIGYHSDNFMEVSAYRDYVIDAFNRNLPFDQFTIEQLAGDLLPEAGLTQRVASGYNRLLQTTEEGGAQPGEYMAIYAADRVRNLSEVWLGLTMGCAQCHDHKYDPLTMRDFYSMAAFFADLKENAVGRREPNLKLPTPGEEAEIVALKTRLAENSIEKVIARDPALAAKLETGQAEWETSLRAALAGPEQSWRIIQPADLKSSGGAELRPQPDGSVLSTGAKNPDKDVYTGTLAASGKIFAVRLEALTHESLASGSLSRGNGNFLLTGFRLTRDGEDLPFARALADFSQDGHPVDGAIDLDPETGWAGNGHEEARNRVAVFVLAAPVDLGQRGELRFEMRHESRFTKHNIGRFRLSLGASPAPDPLGAPEIPLEIREILSKDPAEVAEQEKQQVTAHYRTISSDLAPHRKNLVDWRRRIEEIEAGMRTMLVSETLETPRTTRILPRGDWLDESGEIVEPALPAFFALDPVQGRRANRLDLARWIVSDTNPLTARTFVNRLWAMFFGEGISRDLGDLGGQGAPPSHPELLDWLAAEFRESGWDVKHLIRLMVMSGAYRQNSIGSAESRAKDPGNLWLTRQGRWRLEAELVRDAALQVSGLLAGEQGGKSVKPYQPAGYWQHLNFPPREWEADRGSALYRRGLYTFWCRTFLHPAMLAFDAPSREECTARRARSNIPQQALALLNDPSFVEAARVFGESVSSQGGTVEEKIAAAWTRATSRAPSAAETGILKELFEKQKNRYAGDGASARQLFSIGESPVPKDADAAELAAWTQVARAILNAYETTSRF